MHWDGARWTIFPSGNDDGNELTAVVADATNDVWAVGSRRSGTVTLAEHWDGHHWGVANTPTSGALFGVAAISPQDVWVVGTVGSGPFCRNNNSCTLAEHWDGARWTLVNSPNPDFDNALNAVTAITTHDVWSAGVHSSSGRQVFALTEHWNGTSWAVVPATIYFSFLSSVSAASTKDAWTVGHRIDLQANKILTYTEHWDGRQWMAVSSPNAKSNWNFLNGVAVVSAIDILAVGSTQGPSHALALQYRCSSL